MAQAPAFSCRPTISGDIVVFACGESNALCRRQYAASNSMFASRAARRTIMRGVAIVLSSALSPMTLRPAVQRPLAANKECSSTDTRPVRGVLIRTSSPCCCRGYGAILDLRKRYDHFPSLSDRLKDRLDKRSVPHAIGNGRGRRSQTDAAIHPVAHRVIKPMCQATVPVRILTWHGPIIALGSDIEITVIGLEMHA